MSVILILLILYLHKENHMYDYIFFSPITITDISTSEYSSAYLYNNFKHFLLTLYSLFGGTTRRCPAILWLACDYNSNIIGD